MCQILLICGIMSALCYVATDIAAAILYSGYSFTDQAVSELFAIGAPTSRIVVPLFTLSSFLLAVFALGVWLSSLHSRVQRLMAAMFAGSALIGMVLWNFFPMHMRGAEPTFTDTMHLILATNPFVLLSIALAVAAFRGWFRIYTAATILILLVPAVFAFQYARGEDIFLGANDRRDWLEIFKKVCERFNWVCHAYCLMDNHYHIVVETIEGNLSISKGMRQLNGVYTQQFNRTHERVGHSERQRRIPRG